MSKEEELFLRQLSSPAWPVELHSFTTFSCRRRQVFSGRSDNGAKLVGANRELKQALADPNHKIIRSALVQDGVTWNFILPTESHHDSLCQHLFSALCQQTHDGVEGLFSVKWEPFRTPDLSLHLSMRTITWRLWHHSGKPLWPPGPFEQMDPIIRGRKRQVPSSADLSKWWNVIGWGT